MKIQYGIGLVATLFSSSVFCETLTYDFKQPYYDNKCRMIMNAIGGSVDEPKRREVISQYGLPKNIQWEMGTTRNEWGDEKETFCYLKHGGTYYLWFPFHPVWKSDPPIRFVK